MPAGTAEEFTRHPTTTYNRCEVDMSSVNISGYLQQDVFNASIEATSDNARNKLYFTNVAMLVVCVLGLPGNLLVVTVYARRLTTSTRVYMFALAVADFVNCVCVIMLAIVPVSFLALNVIVFLSDLSTGFSTVLLALCP